MKKALVFVLGVLAFAAFGGEQPVIDLNPIPSPVQMKADWTKCAALKEVNVVCSDSSAHAEKWVEAHLKEWYGDYAPSVQVKEMNSRSEKLPNGEAYQIWAEDGRVTVRALSLAGVRWALYTLRQLVIPKRGTLTTQGFIVPNLTIFDSPKLKFRGFHLCWFPEVRREKIEREIRLAALLKFNVVVVEMWGSFRSEKHPWRNWPEATVTKQDVRRLVEVGRDLGVVVVPQFPAFGHAAMSRASSSKHCTLDLHPEYEPLYEPGGWNWCLTNPETQRILREAIDELMDAFDSPPYFHLGCDEAQPPTCPDCRARDYVQLVGEHIAALAKYVKDRGARPMMWHDMLLEKGDARWAGYVANGSDAADKLLATLPRDLVICDWQYDNGTNVCTSAWPTMRHLKKQGFDVVGCPWENMRAAQTMGAALSEMDAFGLLQTTWHHTGPYSLALLYRSGAAAAWGTPFPPDTPQCDSEFDRALRFVGYDMKVKSYRDTGRAEDQSY